MISTEEPKLPVIRESKINHKSGVLHPLARFVTEDTAALLFNLKLEEIYRIDCWKHVVYVHGKGVSKFVSYADFPPIVEVTQPTPQDFVRWRKRWRKSLKIHQAPKFWKTFYTYQFQYAPTISSFLAYGELVAVIKQGFSTEDLKELRDVYTRAQCVWNDF
ncbi:MAG: hypothetical protein WBB28_22860 [Crinalium sp.]